MRGRIARLLPLSILFIIFIIAISYACETMLLYAETESKITFAAKESSNQSLSMQDLAKEQATAVIIYGQRFSETDEYAQILLEREQAKTASEVDAFLSHARKKATTHYENVGNRFRAEFSRFSKYCTISSTSNIISIKTQSFARHHQISEAIKDIAASKQTKSILIGQTPQVTESQSQMEDFLETPQANPQPPSFFTESIQEATTTQDNSPQKTTPTQEHTNTQQPTPTQDNSPQKKIDALSGEGVKVGVLEQGISGVVDNNNSHFLSQPAVVQKDQPTHYHATYVAATIRSVAPKTQIYSARMEYDVGLMQVSMDFLLENNVSLINASMSMACHTGWEKMYDYYFELYTNEYLLTFVVAAGNQGGVGERPEFTDYLTSPANAANVIAVGALEDGHMASYSSFRNDYGVEKPDVVSTCGTLMINRDGKWHRARGTSFSTPMVAGYISLLLEQKPQLALYPERIHALVTASSKLSDTYDSGEVKENNYTEKAGAGEIKLDNLAMSTTSIENLMGFSVSKGHLGDVVFSKRVYILHFIKISCHWLSKMSRLGDFTITNYDLRLLRDGEVVASSNSVKDNTELIYYKASESGYYDIEVVMSGKKQTETVDVGAVCFYQEGMLVLFEPNGGSGSMNAQKLHNNVAATLNANSFFKKGHAFEGWAFFKDGEVELKDKAVIDPSDATTILYASWRPISYTVIYNANGGSGDMQPTQARYGTSFSLEPCAFKKEGYLFKGWSQNQYGGGLFFSGQENVQNLATIDGQEVHLFAVWTMVEATIDDTDSPHSSILAIIIMATCLLLPLKYVADLTTKNKTRL